MKGGISVNKKNIIIMAAATVILILCPLFCGDYILTVLTTVMITSILGQSWNLLSGYAGQFSFGQAAFFGIGAYASAVLYMQFGISPWIGIIAGMIAAALAGLGLGFLSFKCRIKGDYFALVTLAFAELLRLLVYNSANTAFNGPSGLFVKYIKGGDISAFQFSSWEAYFYIFLGFAFIITLLMMKLKTTKFGLEMIAIRENEIAANALGTNVFRKKLSVIAISAALAALAGGFYAQYYLFIDPSSVFGTDISIQAIIVCIIGGSGTAFGPVLGAFILVPVQEITASLFTDISGINMVFYGILMVVFIMFAPNGILGIIGKTGKKRRLMS